MNNNMIKQVEWKAILFFSIPIMFSQLLQLVYNLTNSLIVGNFLGSQSFGAIGVTSSSIWLLLNIVIGLGSGVSIALSQYIGAGRKHDIASIVSTSFIFSILMSLVMTVMCVLVAGPLIVGFLGTPAEIQGESQMYFIIYSCGIVFQMIYNVTFGILRAYGDSKGSLLSLIVSTGLNLVLGIIFIVYFKWGVAGVGIATVIAQFGSAVASFIYMWVRIPELRLQRKQWIFDKKKLKVVLDLAVPIIVQSSIMSFGFIVLQRLVNSFGAPSIEGFFAMNNVEQILLIPLNSFKMGISSFAGQNIGAGNHARVKKGFRETLYMACAMSAVLVVFIFLSGKSLLGLFNLSPEATQRGLEHLQVIAVFTLMNTVHNITVGLLQGVGDVRITAVAGFVNLAIRLAASYLMAMTFVGYRSIYWSIPFAWITAFVITTLRYRSGAWEHKAIVQ